MERREKPFELYKKTGAGFEKVKEETIETAENGTAMISDLPVKEGQGGNSTRTAYYLKEVLPPDAEMRPGEIKGSAKVEEKDGGYFSPAVCGGSGTSGQQILANYKPIGKAVVIKRMSLRTGNGFRRSVHRLFGEGRRNKREVVASETTDDKGEAVFLAEPGATYDIEETKPPEGCNEYVHKNGSETDPYGRNYRRITIPSEPDKLFV